MVRQFRSLLSFWNSAVENDFYPVPLSNITIEWLRACNGHQVFWIICRRWSRTYQAVRAKICDQWYSWYVTLSLLLFACKYFNEGWYTTRMACRKVAVILRIASLPSFSFLIPYDKWSKTRWWEDLGMRLVECFQTASSLKIYANEKRKQPPCWYMKH